MSCCQSWLLTALLINDITTISSEPSIRIPLHLQLHLLIIQSPLTSLRNLFRMLPVLPILLGSSPFCALVVLLSIVENVIVHGCWGWRRWRIVSNPLFRAYFIIQIPLLTTIQLLHLHLFLIFLLRNLHISLLSKYRPELFHLKLITKSLECCTSVC